MATHTLGFITAKSGIENKILKKIVDEKIVSGVVSMPSNVFVTTGTNVSVIFFDKSKKDENAKVILIDASKTGEGYKEGSNQKRRLRDFEIDKIVDTFLKKEAVEDFSAQMKADTEELSAMFKESHKLEEEIQKQLKSLRFNDCETK